MAATVWATVSLVGFGGPQPESVLPANALGFAKVDLDIDGSQAIDLLRFADRLPDELGEEFEGVEDEDDTAAPFAEVFADTYDLEASEVEGWIGRKVGVASWPTDNTDFASEGGVAFAIALAVEDAGAAEARFTELSETHGLAHTMVDDFVVFSEHPAAIDDYHDQMSAHGDLESDDVYSGDLGDVPSGSIALAWVDLASLAGIRPFREQLATEFGAAGTVQGRMTASFRVTGEYLEARMDVFGLSVEGEDLSWLAEGTGAGVEAMGGLPENTTVALGGSGLDRMLAAAWENDALPLLDDQDRRAMESDLTSVGAPPPDGFTSLLGTSTAVGLSDFDTGGYGSSVDPTVVFRAVDGDPTALAAFVDEVVAPPASTGPRPTVTEDGATVVVATGGTGGAVLADDQVFQQTMAGMEDTVAAAFVDVRRALTHEEVRDPEQWGAVGVALSVTQDGDRAAFELRWAPSGG
ncbi:DUF3352 domain-containing protein [Nocardiopsis sp. MG754419]|uniref:DUF3352 domain-containing protein n=1 Tax=Nocardiopsis sp. MG754419 TaxID=2259865 RepID=UPI0020137FF6|nr:DUF3352 domain-containing protein [Nocardiopsis sp. MG754419]